MPATWTGDDQRGHVYLISIKLADSIYKLGRTMNLRTRMCAHGLFSKDSDGRFLVWTVRTNYLDRLEDYWKRRWAKMVVGHQLREIFRLPDSEVASFRRFKAVIYKDWPRLPESFPSDENLGVEKACTYFNRPEDLDAFAALPRLRRGRKAAPPAPADVLQSPA